MRSPTDSIRTHIPTKRKIKFPVEFKKETIDLGPENLGEVQGCDVPILMRL